MRIAACIVALALALGGASRPVVSRGAVAAVEKNFDQKIVQDLLEDPYLLLGMTRGVYLPGYGAVFTMEMNLAHGASAGPFGPVPQEQLGRVHKKKLEMYPRLKKAMREMLVSAAGALDTVPADERLVLGVSLVYHRAEITTGLPQQVVMTADRKTLLSFQTNRRTASALESAIAVEEILN